MIDKEVTKEPVPLTDVGNCIRFAEQHGGRVKYIHAWHKWLVWNGRYWELDPSGEVDRLARETAKSIYVEAADFSSMDEGKKVANWAHGSQSKFRLSAMLDLAKSEQPIPLDYKTLNSDGWQLNCENGTLDLKTGELKKHFPADFITLSTRVEYPTCATEAALWLRFLNDIFKGNQELIGFVQRLCGSALVGVIREHILPIAYGEGSNGKTVFFETVRDLLGDYAMTAVQGLLMAKRTQSHSTEVADLFSKRLVLTSETDDGAKLNEGLVKSLTGGEAIRARRMREDNWQFDPSHTIILVTNHRPVVKGTDHGIWRRLRIIPFTLIIPDDEQDGELGEKLCAEYPAILQWMVQGCLDWQQGGLREPEEVLMATDKYKSEQDTLGVFISDCCQLNPGFKVTSSALYNAYQTWCDQSGDKPENNRSFKASMEAKGYQYKKTSSVWVEGLALDDH